MPFITNLWFRFAVALVGTTLHPPDPAKGYTPDIVMSIYPNTSHPGGRAPVQSITPFPFNDDCYDWLESMATVRLRRKVDLFDEDSGVQVEVMQHVILERRLGEDFQRSVPLKTMQDIREPLLAHAAVCPSSQDSRLSAHGDSRPPCGDLPSSGSNNSNFLKSDTFEADMEALLCKHNIFGLAHDPHRATSLGRPVARADRPSHGRHHSKPA